MDQGARFLRRHLKLEVNVEKSQVVPTDQLMFFGFSFRGTRISWSAKSMARFVFDPADPERGSATS